LQDIAAEAVKKKRRATKKPYSRSIVGATLEVIQKKRAEKPEVRDAAREAALRYITYKLFSCHHGVCLHSLLASFSYRILTAGKLRKGSRRRRMRRRRRRLKRWPSPRSHNPREPCPRVLDLLRALSLEVAAENVEFPFKLLDYLLFVLISVSIEQYILSIFAVSSVGTA